MSGFLNISLFFSSLFPLWFSISLYDIYHLIFCNNNQSSFWLYIVTIIAILLLILFASVTIILSFKKGEKRCSRKRRVDSAVEEKVEASSFLLSYVLPLAAFDFSSLVQVLQFLLYFTVLCYLQIKHKIIGSNLFLEVFGFNCYKCVFLDSDERDVERYVISRKNLKLAIGDEVQIVELNNEYALML